MGVLSFIGAAFQKARQDFRAYREHECALRSVMTPEEKFAQDSAFSFTGMAIYVPTHHTVALPSRQELEERLASRQSLNVNRLRPL